MTVLDTLKQTDHKHPLHLQPHQIGMTWQYTIDWIPGGVGSGGALSKNVVVVTSKPRSRTESDLLLVDAWTSEVDGKNGSDVSAFVRVTRGGMPVLGARVRMEVGKVDDGTTVFVADMLDDGFGGKLTRNYTYSPLQKLTSLIA